MTRLSALALMIAVLTGGCHPSSSEYLLTDLEGYHPQFGHPLGWLDRSVLVVVPVAPEAAPGLKFSDKVVLCFSKVGRTLRFSGVVKADEATDCAAHVAGEVVALGGDADPVMVQPMFAIDGPWFNRDAQRRDRGVIKEISIWVRLGDDGSITKGTVAAVGRRAGYPIAPK